MLVNYVTSLPSKIPSYRYRMRLPSSCYKSVFSKEPVDADVHFFGKPFNPKEIEMAKGCKNVVFDLCDDWFNSNNRDNTLLMCSIAKKVVVPTKMLASVVYENTGKIPEIISDPCEFDEHPAKIIDTPRLLWYGLGNFDTIAQLKKLPYPIEIVCYENGKSGNATFTEWSIDNMKKAFSRNNIVVIPSIKTKNKMVKSPNRLIEGLRSGLHVVAAPLPSYIPFKEFSELTWDMNEGIQKTGDIKKIENGQKYIRENHEVSIIGEKWKNLFESILGAEDESLMVGSM